MASVDPLQAIFGVLESFFQDWLKGKVVREKQKTLIERAIDEFKRHRIWSDIRDLSDRGEGFDADSLALGCNQFLAQKIIESMLLPEEQRAKKEAYLFDNWMYYAHAKTETQKQKASELFNLFMETIVTIRNGFVEEDLRLMGRNLERDIASRIEASKSETLDAIRRQNSFSQFIDQSNTIVETNREHMLYFKSGRVPFVGRREEFAQLFEFCNCEGNLKWWCAIGKGGIGQEPIGF